MPAKATKKQPPAAPIGKRAVHAFYLAQPLLQFLALMAVFFVLVRCSPLNSSTDRTLKKISADGAVATSIKTGDAQAEEEDIKHALKDASDSDEMTVYSEAEYTKFVANSLYSDTPASSGRVRAIFEKHALEENRVKRSTRLLAISLTPEQRLKIKNGGNVRINLFELLGAARMSLDTRKFFVSELRKISHLEARVYLILPNDAMQAPEVEDKIPVHTRTAVAILSDEKAFLQVSRIIERNIDDSQQELIKSNFDRSVGIAIVLE
jgi:hypothetical protein